MPIRYAKHNRPLKNRKQAKVRENRLVHVKWKDRRDVLVKPYEFDHPLTLRAKRLAPKKTAALGIDESKIILTPAEKACDLFALAGYRLIRINNLAEKA